MLPILFLHISSSIMTEHTPTPYFDVICQCIGLTSDAGVLMCLPPFFLGESVFFFGAREEEGDPDLEKYPYVGKDERLS